MAKINKDEDKKFVFTTKNIEEITNQINDGYVIKRYQNPWFKNEVGVRRHGVKFSPTQYEIDEYIKCALDVKYFAEKYCKVKTEDGAIRNITLRDYQEDILDLFSGQKSILCASRQIGKCSIFNTEIEIDNLGTVRLGILYYSLVSSQRKLTFLEKLKIKLYNILHQFETKHR